MQRAVDDLRALLLHTPQGQFPAAGIPWFVAAFGRDSLLSGYMLLPHQQETAIGVLRYLASYQGTAVDPGTAEEPGKILHELRFGELTHKGLRPHGPYYGTIDATPLFIILLGELHRRSSEDSLIHEFRDNWEAALLWLQDYGDRDGDGFLEYLGAEPGKGLVVQSWKDSDDSMSHSDGSLACGSIVPVEAQGYAYRAYRIAQKFYGILGETERQDFYRSMADNLQRDFHQAFWLEELGTYAMALDGKKQALEVKSSNPGHLLWSGIVAESVAPRLVKTLMGEELWSGWGIRTLGTREHRYNPLSYHNGSVWPHDSALIAAGMKRYGFSREASMIRNALFDLAYSQHDHRLPELIGGYRRNGSPPIPYPVACRPQAWDAAALVFLMDV